MVKMIGFLCAGMIGTGVYFGGISAMVNQVSGSSELEPNQVELVEAPASMVDDNGTQKQFRIETQEDGQRVQETGVSDSESQDDSLSKRFLLTTPEGRATVQEMAVLAQVGTDNKKETGDQQKVEKAGFKIKTTSKDSLITLTFWLPESADESVLVDMTMYNLMGNAVAKPVRQAYSAGTYTVTQTKRGIPDGMYFISMKVNQEPIVNRKMNLVWEDRK